MKHALLLVALFLSSSACTYSGLPGDVALSELTEEQSQQLCSATETYLEDNLSAQDRKNFACNLTGAIAGALVGEDAYAETCTDAQQSCLEEPDDEEDTTTASDCDSAVVSNCTATVEQYEACTREIVSTIKESNASFSCDDGPTTDEEDDEESACEVYQRTCNAE